MKKKEELKILHFLHEFLNFICSLLGQSGQGINHSKKMLLLVAWYFFACYILMENMYQGFIFANLSTTTSPVVPKTFANLLQSSLRILTLSAVTKQNSNLTGWSKMSILKDNLLPTVFASASALNNTAFSQVLKKFDSKLIDLKIFETYFLNETFSTTTLDDISIPHLTKKLTPHPTFAVIDMRHYLNMYSQLIEFLGERLIIENHADTPFQLYVFDIGIRNFMYPRVNNVLQKICESGIEERWSIQEAFNEQIKIMYKFGDLVYSRAFAKRMAGRKPGQIVPEKKSVSLTALKYLFAFSSLIISCSTLVVIAEYLFHGGNFVIKL